MLECGRALPELRASVNADLELEGLERRRVLAVAVCLLDLGFFRIGGEQYAIENETFGVATLLRRHVKLSGGQLVFDYPAKGSIERVVTISDPQAFALLAKLPRRRGGGDQLLEYKSRGRFVPIRSDDVNAYIRGPLGQTTPQRTFARGKRRFSQRWRWQRSRPLGLLTRRDWITRRARTSGRSPQR